MRGVKHPPAKNRVCFAPGQSLVNLMHKPTRDPGKKKKRKQQRKHQGSNKHDHLKSLPVPLGWVWLKIKQEGLRMCWPIFPLTDWATHFGFIFFFFEPQPGVRASSQTKVNVTLLGAQAQERHGEEGPKPPTSRRPCRFARCELVGAKPQTYETLKKCEAMNCRTKGAYGHGLHNLWRSHFGVDEHPFATYFDVHQGTGF